MSLGGALHWMKNEFIMVHDRIRAEIETSPPRANKIKKQDGARAQPKSLK